MDLFESLSQVKKKLLEAKNPFLCYDTDTDGFTSYLQLKILVPNLAAKPFAKSSSYQKNLQQYILQQDYDLIMFIDTPVIKDEFLEPLKDKEFIWVDHHLSDVKNLVEKYDIFYVNPLEFDSKDSRPASWLAYHIVGDEKNLPLSVLGTVSDFYVTEEFVQLYKKDKSSFELLFSLEEQRIQEIISFISTSDFRDESQREERGKIIREVTYGGNLAEFKNLLDIMFKLKPRDLIDSAIQQVSKLSLQELLVEMNAGKGLLFEDYALMKSKYKKLLAKALEEKKDNRIFYTKSSKTSFSRQISEELLFREPEIDFVCICFKSLGGDKYSCSMRGNKTSVKDVLDKAVVGLENSSGGGHKFAVGARVDVKEFETFKQRVGNYPN